MDLSYMELATAELFVGSNGGEVAAVDGDGVVQWELGLRPGRHPGAKLVQFLAPGDVLRAGEGVMPLGPVGKRAMRMKMGEVARQSGANPEYRPSAADTAARQLKRQIEQMARKSRAVEARIEALDRIARERERETVEVIEPPEPRREDPPAKPDEPPAEPKKGGGDDVGD